MKTADLHRPTSPQGKSPGVLAAAGARRLSPDFRAMGGGMNLPVSFLAEVRFHVASCCRRHARAKLWASRLVFCDPMLLPQVAPVGPENPARTRARDGRPKFRLTVPAGGAARLAPWTRGSPPVHSAPPSPRGPSSPDAPIALPSSGRNLRGDGGYGPCYAGDCFPGPLR